MKKSAEINFFVKLYINFLSGGKKNLNIIYNARSR